MTHRIRTLRYAGFILSATPFLFPFAVAQKSETRKKLDAYLSPIGAAESDRRAAAVAAIHTREEMDRRQAEVRQKILDLIGGLPKSYGPVRFKQFGGFNAEGFRVEKVAYESLPGLYVTADVYVPTSGSGPFPAVVVTPGHGNNGKISNASWAANFARAGIVTLAIDAFGQGERLQHWDPEMESTKVERSGEHEHANLTALLIGQHIARYFVNDGMRGVDYLIQRKDVDAAHIGAFGCSGGGTATAYLGALDKRISVTGTACYITSLKDIMPATGAQDAEQTIPGFLPAGLDLADWVELAAPRPYAIISTTEDMFPFAGAKAAYEESKHVYSLYGAEDKLAFITGPGGHGNLGPISQQILAFMVKHLKNDLNPPTFTPYFPPQPDQLIVTPTGQISTSLGGETIESITRKNAGGLMVVEKAVDSQAALTALQTRVRAAARSVTGMTAQPGAAIDAKLGTAEPRDGYRVQSVTLRSEPGVELAAIAAIADKPGPKPAVLLLDDAAVDRTAMSPDVMRLVKAGHFVLVLQTRGTPSAPPTAQTTILGTNTGAALQAMVVGKSLVGMRADDAIRAIDWLTASPEVDRSAITIYGKGPLGMAALHAAAIDTRIARVVVENNLVSYRVALEMPLHRNLSDIVLPGVLLHYDVPDLLLAIAPRPVTLANVVDAMAVPMRDDAVHKELATVFASDVKLGTPGQVRVIRRGFRDPLPIE